MIAVIIDLIASRAAKASERRSLNKKIRKVLSDTDRRFAEFCVASSSLSKGDSIELLVTDWHPIIYTFHRLLSENIRFRVGIGTGKIDVLADSADKCDGEGFWNAREALDETKKKKYLQGTASFRLARRTKCSEEKMVLNSILFLATLLSLTHTQLRFGFYYLWENKQITDIARTVETSKANVSKVLSKTPFYLLRDVISLGVSPASA